MTMSDATGCSMSRYLSDAFLLWDELSEMPEISH